MILRLRIAFLAFVTLWLGALLGIYAIAAAGMRGG